MRKGKSAVTATIEARVIPAATSPIQAVVSPPGSKSITNRALLVAALADGPSVLTGALFSDDTHYMSEALRLAGVPIESDSLRHEFRVEGKGGPGLPVESVFVGNSGTTMRFLTAYFALSQGRTILDGSPRMQERPIQELMDALNGLGAKVRAERGNGCPPVVIEGCGLRGGGAAIPGNRSSQFLSALLLSAPYARKPVIVEVIGELIHKPYLDLTADVMEAFGVRLENDRYQQFHVAPGRYQGRGFAIEPDASAASYPLAAAALTGGTVTIRNLSLESRQGDIEFARLLERMGCGLESGPDGLTVHGPFNLKGLDVDMNSCSDVALTLAAVAPFCTTPTHIRNVGHIRLQETDRIHAIVTELRRAGVSVEDRPDGFSIFPAAPRPTTFETYDDHRMAMSLALIGLRTPGCAILNPDCVNKTYPGFFEMLEELLV